MSFKYHQILALKELGYKDGALAAGLELLLPSREAKSYTLDHARAQRSLSVALEFKAGMRFRKQRKLKIENSKIDLRMAQRMKYANFMSLRFTVQLKFLGQTNVCTHFLFYITDCKCNSFM